MISALPLKENIYYYDNNTSYSNSNADLNRGRTSYGVRGGTEFILGEADILTFGGRAAVGAGEVLSEFADGFAELELEGGYVHLLPPKFEPFGPEDHAALVDHGFIGFAAQEGVFESGARVHLFGKARRRGSTWQVCVIMLQRSPASQQ